MKCDWTKRERKKNSTRILKKTNVKFQDILEDQKQQMSWSSNTVKFENKTTKRDSFNLFIWYILNLCLLKTLQSQALYKKIWCKPCELWAFLWKRKGSSSWWEWFSTLSRLVERLSGSFFFFFLIYKWVISQVHHVSLYIFLSITIHKISYFICSIFFMHQNNHACSWDRSI